MPSAIRITGLVSIQRALGTSFEPVIQGATKAIAELVKSEIAPYPPATAANKPGSEPGDRWYKRGTGGFRINSAGQAVQTSESEGLGRRWSIRPAGRVGHMVGNPASYAPYVLSADKQTKAFKRIGWKTDLAAMQAVVQSGDAVRVVVLAIQGALRKRLPGGGP